MADRCSVCGETFTTLNPFARHQKPVKCISCRKLVGTGCFRSGSTQAGKSGPICAPCWKKQGGDFVPEFESVADAIKGFFPVARQQIDVVKEDLKEEIHELRKQTKEDVHELRLQVKEDVKEITKDLKEEVHDVRGDIKGDVRAIKEEIKGDANELKEDLKKDVDGQITKVDDMVKEWLGHAQGQIDRSIQKAFGYLWITMTSTLFLTFVGLIYFTMVREGAETEINPIYVFRVSLVVLVAAPTLFWLFTAFRRAWRNKSLKDYMKEKREGRALSLKDYLFGFLYFRDPVQNIWGPVVFLGIFFAGVIFLLVYGMNLV